MDLRSLYTNLTDHAHAIKQRKYGDSAAKSFNRKKIKQDEALFSFCWPYIKLLDRSKSKRPSIQTFSV